MLQILIFDIFLSLSINSKKCAVICKKDIYIYCKLRHIIYYCPTMIYYIIKKYKIYNIILVSKYLKSEIQKQKLLINNLMIENEKLKKNIPKSKKK